MARHGEVEGQMDSQVSTELVFEYLCGMGEEGTKFAVRKMTSANPNPREDLRELFVYYLSALYILRVDFQCEVFQSTCAFLWVGYWCCFLIHGDAIDDNCLMAKGASIVGTLVQQPSSCGPNPQAVTRFKLGFYFCFMF
jgi:hypothetical protein